jgi:hypothetical protein
MTIVKVQLPLVTNVAEAPALVYGEGHLFMTQQVLDAETLKAMENDVKAFLRSCVRQREMEDRQTRCVSGLVR